MVTTNPIVANLYLFMASFLLFESKSCSIVQTETNLAGNRVLRGFSERVGILCCRGRLVGVVRRLILCERGHRHEQKGAHQQLIPVPPGQTIHWFPLARVSCAG